MAVFEARVVWMVVLIALCNLRSPNHLSPTDLVSVGVCRVVRPPRSVAVRRQGSLTFAGVPVDWADQEGSYGLGSSFAGVPRSTTMSGFVLHAPCERGGSMLGPYGPAFECCLFVSLFAVNGRSSSEVFGSSLRRSATTDSITALDRYNTEQSFPAAHVEAECLLLAACHSGEQMSI